MLMIKIIRADYGRKNWSAGICGPQAFKALRRMRYASITIDLVINEQRRSTLRWNGMRARCPRSD